MNSRVLIIDDENLFREDLASLLRRKGHQCQTASDGQKGLDLIDQFQPDVVLCDIVMPGKGGVDILEQIVGLSPQTPVIMITAYGSLDTAVAAFRQGAADYITKPLLIEDVLQKIERLLHYRRISRELLLLRRELSQTTSDQHLVGQSEPIEKVRELIRVVAGTKSTVLICGQTGTGKEVVARSICAMSDSAQAPFVAINCAGIPEELLESELFGHVRGAFTGSIADKAGFFELAGAGTIFLDEIAEMPLSLQSKLLRVLEQKEFYRVGGTKAIRLESRLIVSSNRNLRELSQAGKFREDLYFRIAVFEIALPSLRERPGDIPLLVEHFIKHFNQEMKRRCLGVDNEVIRRLMAYSWPGNVRELRNVIEHAMILSQGDYILLEELPAEVRTAVKLPEYSENLRQAIRAYEAEHIRRVLLDCGGNREETARRLEINPSTLYRKMADLHLIGQ